MWLQVCSSGNLHAPSLLFTGESHRSLICQFKVVHSTTNFIPKTCAAIYEELNKTEITLSHEEQFKIGSGLLGGLMKTANFQTVWQQ